MTRRRLLGRAAAAAAGLLAVDAVRGAKAGAAEWELATIYRADVPVAWFDLMLKLVQHTPGYSPPVASRAFGYAGVTLYEAVEPGLPGSSLAGHLNGLGAVPGPAEPLLHWPSVANSALATILRLLFPTAPSRYRAAVDALERRFAIQGEAMAPAGIYERSVRRGTDVALHIFEWSKTDGGHEGYRRNFPPFTPPSGPGLWVPTPPAFLPALQPYWGSNRPFVLPSGDTCDPGPPPPYSEDPGSAFYAEAYDVYQAVNNLTPEERAIALFWSDDAGLTTTPPGHSISILTQVLDALNMSLARAAEAYAKVGIAVADAFISGWATKFRYNLLRPVTYIQRVIDPGWMPLVVTPPFPEYTSGHSAQSAAAAHVMTDLFGDVAFTDHTHDARGLAPRSFGSFMEAAREAAISRMYGGIHFQAGIERGLAQGICVGRHVSAL